MYTYVVLICVCICVYAIHIYICIYVTTYICASTYMFVYMYIPGRKTSRPPHASLLPQRPEINPPGVLDPRGLRARSGRRLAPATPLS